jgi:uncharacterized protein
VRDDKFLELAVADQATCIITGDSDSLDLHTFRGIPIVARAQLIGLAAGA